MIATSVEQNILDCMPYRSPFRFIDEILEISDSIAALDAVSAELELRTKKHKKGNKHL